MTPDDREAHNRRKRESIARWAPERKEAHLARRREHYMSSTYTPEQREANAQRKRERANKTLREIRLERTYGCTREDFDVLYVSQEGRCALCARPLWNWFEGEYVGAEPHIDHCHDTTQVRGLLCKVCNSAMGWFERRDFASIEAYLTRRVDFDALPEPAWEPVVTRPTWQRRFGGTAQMWAQLWELQNALCGICATDLDALGLDARGRSMTHFDHCRDLLVARGLLCNACNTGLGWYEKRLRPRIDVVQAYLAVAI